MKEDQRRPHALFRSLISSLPFGSSFVPNTFWYSSPPPPHEGSPATGTMRPVVGWPPGAQRNRPVRPGDRSTGQGKAALRRETLTGELGAPER